MSAVTDAVVLSVFGAGAAGIGVYAARHKARNRRRYKLAELTDLTRDDIDRGWERTQQAVEALNGDLEPPDGDEAA